MLLRGGAGGFFFCLEILLCCNKETLWNFFTKQTLVNYNFFLLLVIWLLDFDPDSSTYMISWLMGYHLIFCCCIFQGMMMNHNDSDIAGEIRVKTAYNGQVPYLHFYDKKFFNIICFGNCYGNYQSCVPEPNHTLFTLVALFSKKKRRRPLIMLVYLFDLTFF